MSVTFNACPPVFPRSSVKKPCLVNEQPGLGHHRRPTSDPAWNPTHATSNHLAVLPPVSHDLLSVCRLHVRGRCIHATVRMRTVPVEPCSIRHIMQETIMSHWKFKSDIIHSLMVQAQETLFSELPTEAREIEFSLFASDERERKLDHIGNPLAVLDAAVDFVAIASCCRKWTTPRAVDRCFRCC